MDALAHIRSGDSRLVVVAVFEERSAARRACHGLLIS